MIILIKGILEVLDYFIDAMAAEDDDIIVFDINNPEETLLPYADRIDKNTMVVTFNNVGTNFSIWKNLGVTICNIFVDHPAFYVSMITRDYFAGYKVLCIDRHHVDYLHGLFPQIKDSVMFMPHGGVDKNGRNAAKDIDILYAGGFVKEETITLNPLPFEHDSEQFYKYAVEYYDNNPNRQPQDVVDAYMTHYGYTFSVEEYYVMVDRLLKSLGFMYQARRRQKLIGYLAEAGMHIHICGGDCWEKTISKYPDNITYHGKISPDECINMICRSKVLINDHPNFTAGSHERVFNGMLNGAVVLSNLNEYLGERFKDNEDILFWDGMNYDEAVDKIKHVLEDDSLREQVVQNAYEKVQKDKWSDRLSEITSIFMGR